MKSAQIIGAIVFGSLIAAAAGGTSGRLSAGEGQAGRPATAKGGTMSFSLKTQAFSEGAAIPSRYTCDGLNLSPALTWTGVPAGTKSLALIVEDPDAPGGTFMHWVFFDIGAKVESLPEGPMAAKLGVAGINDFGKSAYGGPCPPRGRGSHRYYFKLSALDIPTLGLAVGATLTQVNQRMSGHVLAAATLMGRYERR